MCYNKKTVLTENLKIASKRRGDKLDNSSVEAVNSYCFCYEVEGR